MTEKEFREWVEKLNKKENIIFDGLFSTVFKKDKVKLIIEDDGYTLTLVFEDIKTSYTSHWNNTITKKEWEGE